MATTDPTIEELRAQQDEIQNEVYALVGSSVPDPKYRANRTVKKRVRMKQLVAEGKRIESQLQALYPCLEEEDEDDDDE